MQAEKPIGYWIRQADELLTKGIDQIQSSFHITRTKWQILNTLHETTFVNKSSLAAAMAPFADAAALSEVLTAMQQAGITAQKDDLITLTPEGGKLYLRCLEQQQQFRQKAMTGITAEDYRTTIKTLQKLATNIGLQGE